MSDEESDHSGDEEEDDEENGGWGGFFGNRKSDVRGQSTKKCQKLSCADIVFHSLGP
jgi:hypothetical protein